MAKGGRATLKLDTKSLKQTLDVVIKKVDRGTRKATLDAVEEIYLRSLYLVPRDTGALYRSAYYEVDGNYKKGFSGIVGYGKPGNVNMKNGDEAYQYAIEVHEDLTVHHEIGEAKYLEKAVREYQADAGSKLKEAFRRHLI